MDLAQELAPQAAPIAASTATGDHSRALVPACRHLWSNSADDDRSVCRRLLGDVPLIRSGARPSETPTSFPMFYQRFRDLRPLPVFSRSPSADPKRPAMTKADKSRSYLAMPDVQLSPMHMSFINETMAPVW